MICIPMGLKPLATWPPGSGIDSSHRCLRELEPCDQHFRGHGERTERAVQCLGYTSGINIYII